MTNNERKVMAVISDAYTSNMLTFQQIKYLFAVDFQSAQLFPQLLQHAKRKNFRLALTAEGCDLRLIIDFFYRFQLRPLKDVALMYAMYPEDFMKVIRALEDRAFPIYYPEMPSDLCAEKYEQVGFFASRYFKNFSCNIADIQVTLKKLHLAIKKELPEISVSGLFCSECKKHYAIAYCCITHKLLCNKCSLFLDKHLSSLKVDRCSRKFYNKNKKTLNKAGITIMG